jgi:hypothetical protein
MLRWRAPFHAQRSTTTPALKMACRLASVPVLTVSVHKRLQDLGYDITATGFPVFFIGNNAKLDLSHMVISSMRMK